MGRITDNPTSLGATGVGSLNALYAGIVAQVDDDGLGGITSPGGRGWALSRQALTSNRMYYTRFRPIQNHVITLAAFHVTTPSGTDDPFEIAIYNSTGATKLATTGAVTASGKLNAAGIKTQALSYSLVAGTVYYAAFAATTTATLACAQFDVVKNTQYYGTLWPLLLAGDTNTSYPLPSSLASNGLAGATFPIITFREV